MKKIVYSVISVILLFLGWSCEKDSTEFKSTANIYVINASIGNGAVKVNPGAGKGFAYSKATELVYNASSVYGAFTGSNTITAVSSTDTTKTFFTKTVDLKPANTLYLAGQSPTIDTMFRAEDLPYIQAAVVNPDSSMYIRFVNLSPTSPAVKVLIKSAATNEVESLPYKGISPFKKYPAKVTTASYIFEVRNATTNELMTSVTIVPNNNRFKTISLVMRGIFVVAPATTTTPYGILQVNYI
jgi:hypothetical protein